MYFKTKSMLSTAVKFSLLAVASALLVWMIYIAVMQSEWFIVAGLSLVLLGANWVYVSKKAVAAKFLFPGIVLLSFFVVIPIIYTAWMSAYNYKTGNEIDKPQAITQLHQVGLIPAAAGNTYDMIVGTENGNKAVLLTDQGDRTVYLGENGKISQLTPGTYSVNSDKVATSTSGWKTWSPAEVAANADWLNTLSLPAAKGTFIAAQGSNLAALMTEKFKFGQNDSQITDVLTGTVYRDNGNGNFVDIKDKKHILYPGWRQFNPAQNYLGLITDPVLRGPFIRVFIWTFVFAFLSVLSMWGLGLLLAVAMDKKMRLRNFYRGVLILPYAMPSFMSILIWAGIFNRDYGALNGLLHAQIDWLNDPWLARLAIMTVNLWLGFPYFYLISTGALQALPTDIEEAAEIDGATGRQIFFQIKLPLIFQILSPLLIASFAFNFNNFNLIYLLTKGGPTDVLNGETAGATDILITYAYKTAFGSNEQNLGLACAISVIMFFIVGALSMWSLRRSKVLEEM